MYIDKHNSLNEIYEPLYKKAKHICDEVTDNGCKASLGWYNMHSVKYENNYLTEFYPIPVITMENFGEIRLSIDSIFIEVTIPKEKALKVDYNSLIENYPIEVYGVDDYLTDFYNADMELSEIKSKISDSNETQIHIGVDLDINTEINKILKVISIFLFK